MSLKISECQKILDAFEKEYLLELTACLATGVHLTFEKDQWILYVHVRRLTEDIARLPREYTSTEKDKTNFVVAPQVAPQFEFAGARRTEGIDAVYAGNLVHPIDGEIAGTAGWFIVLDGDVICITAWHVACHLGNRTPKGRGSGHPQEFADARGRRYNIGRLLNYYNVEGNGNIWDYAEIRVLDPDEELPFAMRPCDGGRVYAYPERLTSPDDVVIGTRCHKVGCVSGCTEFTLTGSFSRVPVREPNTGLTYGFVNQLTFGNDGDTNIFKPGDSGSVIVRSADNSALGLYFSLVEGGATGLANRLYELPIGEIGVVRRKDGTQIPSFRRLTAESMWPSSSVELSADVEGGPTFGRGYTILGYVRGGADGAEHNVPNVISTVRIGPDRIVDQAGQAQVIFHYLLLGRRSDSNGRRVRGIEISSIGGHERTTIGDASGANRIQTRWNNSFGVGNNVLFFLSNSRSEGMLCFGGGYAKNGELQIRPPDPPSGPLISLKVGDTNVRRAGGSTDQFEYYLYFEE